MMASKGACWRRMMRVCAVVIIAHCSLFSTQAASAQSLTVVELNCENLFDYQHDSLKQDMEYLPEATRHWTRKRYWRKLNNIGQELVSCCDDGVADLIALCEVENDSVVRDLTKRSMLRNAGYEYVVTSSPDLRGIDVALLYQPLSFGLIDSETLRVATVADMRPTRDILYVRGRVISGDTLHVFVIHAPSRYGGERYSRPFRQAVADRLFAKTDSILNATPDARIIVAGDFNEEADGAVLRHTARHRLRNLTKDARGMNGAKGTYRYKGRWGSIDHILGSHALFLQVDTTYIHAPRFLLEEEPQYGGLRPRRTYNGMKYQPGYSDHLPLVLRLRWD